ncbi:TusE/DsrC/DsvC family sulfur relay protein [Candidatus Bathyarchaeota archaeon]|nr:TusE/DsrC/DsvC family sulfur relay protein [Candidatus Bathyarchaeota archaeon]
MSTVENNVRGEVILFAKTYYQQHGSAPSIRAIVRRFKKTLNIGRIYELFPDGQGQICREASISLPSDRLNHTSNAQKARVAKTSTNTNSVLGTAESSRLALTEEQTRRIYGISHLEGGKNPNQIITEMLDRDTTVRRLLEHPENMAEMVRFVESGLSRGWKIPWLLEITTNLWNGRVTTLSAQEVGSLVELISELKNRGIEVKQFVQESVNAGSLVNSWRQYRLGQITVDEMIRRLNIS